MSRYSERERDFDFMGWVKTQPCAARDLGRCDGCVEADHAGRRGTGRKAPDDTCVPLCTKHHRERTDFAGDFRAFDQASMRAFLEAAIAATREAWARRCPAGEIPF